MKKGSKMTDEAKRKMSIAQKKRDKSTFSIKKGNVWSPEIQEKLRKIRTGRKQTPEQIEKRVSKMRGENNPRWNGGKTERICVSCGKTYKKWKSLHSITCSKECLKLKKRVTPINKQIRHSKEYKLWRKSVFERDDYTCVWCRAKSGIDKTVFLNADHIKPFAYYPELRFAIDNGRTLCFDCHKKTDTYKKKIKL